MESLVPFGAEALEMFLRIEQPAEEVAHYYRFQERRVGRRYRRGDTPRSGPTGEALSVDLAGVRPMRRNSRVSDPAHRCG